MLEDIFLQYGALGLLSYLIYWQTNKFSKIIETNTKAIARANIIIEHLVEKIKKN